MAITNEQIDSIIQLLGIVQDEMQQKSQVNRAYIDQLINSTTDQEKKEALNTLKDLFDGPTGYGQNRAGNLIVEMQNLKMWSANLRRDSEQVREHLNKVKDFLVRYSQSYNVLNTVLEKAGGYDEIHDKNSQMSQNVVPVICRLSSLYGEFMAVTETVDVDETEESIKEMREAEKKYHSQAVTVYNQYKEKMDEWPTEEEIRRARTEDDKCQSDLESLQNDGKDRYQRLYLDAQGKYNGFNEQIKTCQSEEKEIKDKITQCNQMIEEIEKRRKKCAELMDELKITRARKDQCKKEYEALKQKQEEDRINKDVTNQLIDDLVKKRKKAGELRAKDEKVYVTKAKEYYKLKREEFYWKKTLELSKELKEYLTKNGFVAVILFPFKGMIIPDLKEDHKEVKKKAEELMAQIRKSFPAKDVEKYLKMDDKARSYIQVLNRLCDKAQTEYDKALNNLKENEGYQTGERIKSLRSSVKNLEADYENIKNKENLVQTVVLSIKKENENLSREMSNRYEKSLPDTESIDQIISQKYEQEQKSPEEDNQKVDNAYMKYCMEKRTCEELDEQIDKIWRTTYMETHRTYHELQEKLEKGMIDQDTFNRLKDEIYQADVKKTFKFTDCAESEKSRIAEYEGSLKMLGDKKKELSSKSQAEKEKMDKTSEEAYKRDLKNAQEKKRKSGDKLFKIQEKKNQLTNLVRYHNQYVQKRSSTLDKWRNASQKGDSETLKLLNQTIRDYLRDYGKSRSWVHMLSSDSDEYRAIKTGLEKLRDPQQVQSMKPDEIVESLKQISKACNDYLVAKNAQNNEMFRFESLSTNQRTYRIYFATSIREYCDSQIEALGNSKFRLGDKYDRYMKDREKKNVAEVEEDGKIEFLKQTKEFGQRQSLPGMKQGRGNEELNRSTFSLG